MGGQPSKARTSLVPLPCLQISRLRPERGNDLGHTVSGQMKTQVSWQEQGAREATGGSSSPLTPLSAWRPLPLLGSPPVRGRAGADPGLQKPEAYTVWGIISK